MPVLSIRPRRLLAVLVILACVAAAHLPSRTVAWEGYSFEGWRAISGESKPEIAAPQAGRRYLLPLIGAPEPGSPEIDTIRGWETKRDRILGALRALMGEPSGGIKPPAPEAQILGEEELPDHRRIHLRIRSEADDWIPAYLLIPKPAPAGPTPTMIVLHQTVPQGKDEPCGIDARAPGNPDLAIALDLVRRGWVCLAPDMIGFGERIPPDGRPYDGALDFYRRHPHWSFFGKMCWDVSRMVDWLETRPEVDARRVGLVGHSHGAYGSMMAAAFEPRISAVVASCGFTFLRADPHPDRWSHLTALLPRLGFYVDDINAAPIDWHEIIACLAPRPFFYWGPLRDDNFRNTDRFPPVFEELRAVYGLYGAADLLELHQPDGPHSFPQAAHELAYPWLERMLPRRPDLKSKPASREAWEARRVELKALIKHDLGSVASPMPSEDGKKNGWGSLATVEREGYTEEKIRYLAEPAAPKEEWISAYLLRPTGSDAGAAAGAKRAGIVVFHQTAPEGKEESAGHAGRPSMRLGPELVRRGYVVLLPDSICAGERVTKAGAFETRDFYRAHPTRSALGRMISDGRRALDILQGVEGVDPARLATIGHSLGAEEALFVAAFDDRVRAAAASCGMAPLAAEGEPSRWARDQWFSYVPRWRVDLRAGRLPAWDFDDVIRLVSPRGYFHVQTEDDEIFHEGKAIAPLVERARETWALYGAPERLRMRLEPGPHDFTSAAREEVYAWLDATLSGK